MLVAEAMHLPGTVPPIFKSTGNRLRWKVSGLEATDVENNRIIARVSNPQFRIAVTGFDENRDIRVRADRIGGANAGNSD